MFDVPMQIEALVVSEMISEVNDRSLPSTNTSTTDQFTEHIFEAFAEQAKEKPIKHRKGKISHKKTKLTRKQNQLEKILDIKWLALTLVRWTSAL